jgi:hypothetical protein
MSAPTLTPAHRAAAAAPAHLAGALVALRAAIDGHWPKRDHSSDGAWPDDRHVAEGSASDHNPWLGNAVRALDVDVDGIDAPWLAEQLRLDGMHGDPRLADGGYLIFMGRITSPDFTHWLHYDGDPHTSHLHISFSRKPAGYEYTGPWHFLDVKPGPPQHPQPAPTHPATPAPAPAPPAHAAPHDATGAGADFRAEYGEQGPHVADLQEFLNRYVPLYSDLEVDGIYGPETARVVAEFGQRSGIAEADGRNVGPKIAAVLARAGFSG